MLPVDPLAHHWHSHPTPGDQGFSCCSLLSPGLLDTLCAAAVVSPTACLETSLGSHGIWSFWRQLGRSRRCC